MKTFKEKIHMLADLSERYFSEVYIPRYCSTPEDIVCNYLTTAIVISWNENIQLLCCYVDDDEIEEDNSPLDNDYHGESNRWTDFDNLEENLQRLLNN